jgi:hypothetical protein
MVFQWPKGTFVFSRWPRGAEPPGGEPCWSVSIACPREGGIDEEHAGGVDRRLIVCPLRTPSRDIGAILLAGDQRLFCE